MFRRKPDKNVYANTKQNNPCKPEDLFEKIVTPFTQIKICRYPPKSVETVKNNQSEEAAMKGNPTGRAKPADNFIIIAGDIPGGTEVKGEEVDRHPHYQQQGGNPLQKPRPETMPFSIHYFLP